MGKESNPWSVKAAYLFWLKLRGNLKKLGFVENPYDQCTMNRMFGKEQYTIQWRIDNLKISCRNKSVINSVLSKLSTHYGEIAPLTVTRGIVHDYLGMQIDFSTKEKIIITMHDYTNEIIDSLPDNMRGTVAIPRPKTATQPLKSEISTYFYALKLRPRTVVQPLASKISTYFYVLKILAKK